MLIGNAWCSALITLQTGSREYEPKNIKELKMEETQRRVQYSSTNYVYQTFEEETCDVILFIRGFPTYYGKYEGTDIKYDGENIKYECGQTAIIKKSIQYFPCLKILK